MKILLVDDEPLILENFKMILESCSYDVTTFLSGAEALEALKIESFELVVTDQKMGKVSGTDIKKYIETHRPETPLFLMTGDSIMSLDFSHQCSRVLRKPTPFDEILKAIEEVEALPKA